MNGFDRALLLSLRGPDGAPIGPPWLATAMTDLTALGGHTVIALVTLVAAGFLALRRQPRVALLLIGAVAAGMALSAGLKAIVGRARPALDLQLVTPYGASFPSGHALLSAIAYLTLGAMLARAEADRATRRFVIACAVALTFLVGASRVYLGVHWPTDVLAGWAIGAGWAAATAWLAARLSRRGEVEPPR